jgi:GDP-L-fucose synthase
MKNNNCIITGSGGVLGCALKKILSNKNSYFDNYNFFYPSSKVLDLIDKNIVFDYFGDNKINNIIHLAALSGGIGMSGRDFQASLFFNNVTMFLNLLEAARKFSVNKTLMTLSSGMYSQKVKMPFKEIDLHCGEVVEGSYGYYYAKRMMEVATRAYRDQYNLDIIGVVPNGIFGENMNFDLKKSTLIPSIIRKIYFAKKNNTKVEIWGDGSPLREWTFSKDMAKAILWSFKNYSSSKILNIGNNLELSVKEIVFIICDVMKFDKDLLYFDKSKHSGVQKKSTDNSEFLKLSNFKYTDFKEAIKETVFWFVETLEKKHDKIREN